MIVHPYMKDRLVEAFSALGIADDTAVLMTAIASDISVQTDDTSIWVTMTYKIDQEALKHLSQPPAAT